MQTIASLNRMREQIDRQLRARHRTATALRKRIQTLSETIARLENELASLAGGALDRTPPSTVLDGRTRAARMKARMKGEKVRDIVIRILSDAGRPMRTEEILTEMSARGYRLVAQRPKKSLEVRLYTDPAFKKAGRACFALNT